MKAVMSFLLLCIALGVACCTARAQSVDTVLVAGTAMATTFCRVDSGKVVARTFIDADALGDPHLTEALVHERVHREDMRADPALCLGRARDVLRTEVHAYCVSDQFAAAMGALPLGLYVATLNTLVRQFEGSGVPYEEVVSAWFTRCGQQLGVGSHVTFPAQPPPE